MPDVLLAVGKWHPGKRASIVHVKVVVERGPRARESHSQRLKAKTCIANRAIRVVARGEVSSAA